MVQSILRPKAGALLLTAGIMLAGGCREAPEPVPRTAEPANLAETQQPQLRGPFVPPVPVPPAGREALLTAAFRAASAAAAGIDDEDEQASLAGQQFVVRERFGCGGPEDQGPRRWTFDESGGVLRVHFEPWLAAPAQPQADQGRAREEQDEPDPVAAYSFAEPWLLTATCIAGGGGALPPVGARGGNVALVQTFTDEDSRAARLPETFRTVKRIDADEMPTNGLEMVVSGRLQEGPGGKVIACSRSGAGARPDCVIHVSVDSARIEDPQSGREIAQWGNR